MQDNGTPRSDWQRRNGYAPTNSMSSSPARSTFSIASTMNLYQARQPQSLPQSTTTTPGKVPPPSPLYYDYTEDFEVEDYTQTEATEPPPQFLIDKTIPEDRPMSSHWQAVGNAETFDPTRQFVAGPRASSLPPSMRNGDSNAPRRLSTERQDLRASAQQLSRPVAVESKELSNGRALDVPDKKIIRLSGLGLGAQQLNSHVEEAFGLPSSPSFELLAPDESLNGASGQTGPLDYRLSGSSIATADYMRNSAYSFNTHMQKFPPPPEDVYTGTGTELVVAPPLKRGSSGERRLNRLLKQPPSPASSKRNTGHDGTAEDEAPELVRKVSKKRSSFAAEMDQPDISELSGLEDSQGQRHTPTGQSIRQISKQVPATPSKLHDSIKLSSSGTRVPPSLSSVSLNGDHAAPKLVPDQIPKLTHRPSKKRRVEALSTPIYEDKDVPNFSHQIPRRFMSRSDSPMLAPKPISPARQLKLKNSIPQLMKALPPVPDTIRGVSPPLELESYETQLPYRFSPLIPEIRSPKSPLSQDKKDLYPVQEVVPPVPAKPVELDSLPIDSVPAVPEKENTPPSLQPPKLRLKMKSSGVPPPSPLTSRPWNLEGSYPWSDKLSVDLQPMTPEVVPELTKQPKFKLKIIRSSESTQGTVRINRESGESSSKLNFRNPKDLFTPSADPETVFNKVGKHLHLRRSSASNSQPTDTIQGPRSLTVNQEAALGHHQVSELAGPPVTAESASPTEVRSFFSDNSSHNHNDRTSLKKRLSKFRARITIPYMTKTGTQSHDDITWRNKSRGSGPKATRSHPDLQARRSLDGTTPHVAGPLHRLTEKLRNHHVRERVSEWFREAKSAIRARVKPRNIDSPVINGPEGQSVGRLSRPTT